MFFLLVLLANLGTANLTFGDNGLTVTGEAVVSAGMTVTGALDVDGGADIAGGLTVSGSQTVDQLTVPVL